ncbi:DUF5682 family protein [Paraflavisolibacter sp. H34]|uniref:DUF5682 family protein n=1 Tax=Huijunlia imazamoxiresistens TaxID=3127457 RepID=UPI003018573D
MVTILGIRHHGPGSARNVRAFLEQTRPDVVLVEGPPEADDLLQWVGQEELQPPVAILCYVPDDPKRSVFYPFATFSPEWQAILYARQNNIPVRFMDLPVAHQLALGKEAGEEPKATATAAEYDIKTDPIGYLAEAAGYEEGEKWWEHLIEHRQNGEGVFEAVAEAMQVLRAELRLPEDRLERLREAHMRKTIRLAQKDLFQNVAVVCGAWHAPALELARAPKPKEDNDLLKGLPKVKVECTWTAWTYGRLSFFSGYGAGIQSPGWYGHVWRHPADDGTRWMTGVAALFREKGMDTSVAHVIEAVRLAASLASLRGLSKAGLEELNEATLSVLCNGDPLPQQLIQNELVVGNRLGAVPTGIPKPPLQLDVEKAQKSLRLPPTADFRDYVLDLRKEGDLARSIFLHRLRLLQLHWGKPAQVSGKGTFKEQWRLQWDPAFAIDLIEKGSWGNTVEEAATRFVIHQAGEAPSLLSLSGLLQEALPAELHRAVEVLIRQVSNLAAASGDVLQLMEVVPPLVSVSRYGNVRGTDTALVLGIVTGMVTRICVSLPHAVTGIDDEAAQSLTEQLFQLNESVTLLQQPELEKEWQQTLLRIAAGSSTAPLVGGYATRLLADARLLQGDELVRAFGKNMSAANPPAISASWLEGFLKGSGTLLLLDETLWNLVHNWIAQLTEDAFRQALPLLRRTFAGFSAPERRKLGEKVKTGTHGQPTPAAPQNDLDEERAMRGVPVVLQMLGV